MKKQELKKIFEKKFNEKVINVKDSSRGVDQIVNIVTTENSKYVLKEPKKLVNELIERQYMAFEKLNNKIPLVKILHKTDTYLIEEYLEGEDLDNIILSESKKKELYKELGKHLKTIHSIKTKGYGFIKNGKGAYNSLREMFKGEFEEFLKKDFINNDLIEKKELKKAMNYLKNNDFYLESEERVLLHNDYEEWNIRVKNEKIVGILDFADLSSGSKAYDLARPYITHYNNKKFNYIIEGYGSVDLKEVEFNAFLNLIWMIPYHYNRKNNKELKEKISIFKDIINSTKNF